MSGRAVEGGGSARERVAIEIILPERSADTLSDELRGLTRDLAERGADTGFGLGGEYGYGARHESDEFLMHPYCWCERDDCPWCAGCFCMDDSTSCAWCRGEHRYADKGALPPSEPPHQGAPHFWHKPSGVRVWWYKYIGRGMEVFASDGFDPVEAVRLARLSVRADVHAERAK